MASAAPEKRSASAWPNIQLDNSWKPVKYSSGLAVAERFEKDFIDVFTSNVKTNANKSPNSKFSKYVKNERAPPNAKRSANIFDEASRPPAKFVKGDRVRVAAVPTPTVDEAAQQERDALAVRLSLLEHRSTEVTDMEAAVGEQTSSTHYDWSVPCGPGLSRLKKEDYAALLRALLQLSHADAPNHGHPIVDDWHACDYLFGDTAAVCKALLITTSASAADKFAVCGQCIDELQNVLGAELWAVRIFIVSAIEVQLKKKRLRTTGLINLATTLFPFHISPKTSASRDQLHALHRKIVALSDKPDPLATNYLDMWVRLSPRHQICPTITQTDWVGLQPSEKLFLSRTYAWAALRLAFNERQSLAVSIICNWEERQPVHGCGDRLDPALGQDLAALLAQVEEDGSTHDVAVRAVALVKANFANNEVSRFMLLRSPIAMLTFISTAGSQLPLPLDNRMATAKMNQHGMYQLSVKRSFIESVEVNVRQRKLREVRALFQKATDYYPPSCEVDYRFSTTNPHSILAALVTVTATLSEEQRVANSLTLKGSLQHAVKMLELHPLGWSAWNFVATTASTFDDKLGLKRRIYEREMGLTGLDFRTYNGLAKEISVLVRAFDQLPDGTTLTPEECTASMGFETGLGRYTMHSDLNNEIANRCGGARHLSTKLVADGNFHLPHEDSWGFRQLDPQFYAMLDEELIGVMRVIVDRRVMRMPLEQFLERRQEWLAAGSAAGSGVQVEGKVERGNKRTWSEQFESMAKAAELLCLQPSEVATGSEKHEVDKHRALYAPDANHYLISSYVTAGMEQRLHLLNGIEKGYSGAELLAMEARRCASTIDPEVFITCTDYADFNIQHTNVAMAHFFQAVHDVAEAEGAHPHFLAMCLWLRDSQAYRYFNFLGAASKDKTLYPALQGMFSGTRATDILNTVFNLCYKRIAARLAYRLYAVQAVDEYAVHQGDDVFIANKSLTYSVALVLMMKAIGLRLQKTKQLFSRDKGEFLRIQYAQGKACGILHRALHNAILRPLQSMRLPDPAANLPAIYANLSVLRRRGLSDAAACVWWFDQINRYRRIMAGDQQTVSALVPWEVICYSGWLGGLNCPPPNCLPGRGPMLPALPTTVIEASAVRHHQFPSGMSKDWVRYLSRVIEGHKISANALMAAAQKGNYASVLNAHNRPMIKRELIREWNNWTKLHRRLLDRLPSVRELETHQGSATEVAEASLRGIAILYSVPAEALGEQLLPGVRDELTNRMTDAMAAFANGDSTRISAGALSEVHRAIAATHFKSLANLLLAFDRDINVAIQYVLSTMRTAMRADSEAYDFLARLDPHHLHRILTGLSGLTVFGCEHIAPLANPNMTAVIASCAGEVAFRVVADHPELNADQVRCWATHIGLELFRQWTTSNNDLAVTSSNIMY